MYFPHVIRLMSLQKNLQDEAAVTAIDAATRYYAEMETLLANNDWLAGSAYSFATSRSTWPHCSASAKVHQSPQRHRNSLRGDTA